MARPKGSTKKVLNTSTKKKVEAVQETDEYKFDFWFTCNCCRLVNFDCNKKDIQTKITTDEVFDCLKSKIQKTLIKKGSLFSKSIYDAVHIKHYNIYEYKKTFVVCRFCGSEHTLRYESKKIGVRTNISTI